jgi:hypothetical protein
MGYNAGTKVKVSDDRGNIIPAVITGTARHKKHGQVLAYRDNCAQCQESTLYRHRVGDKGTYIL